MSYTSKFSMVLQLSFCSDIKISLKFLESVALFIAKPNICLGNFFVQMMTQIPYLQRWILFFVFYICKDFHLLVYFGHISTNEDLMLVFRSHYFTSWCIYSLSIFRHEFLWAGLIFPVENLKLRINCLSFFKQVP